MATDEAWHAQRLRFTGLSAGLVLFAFVVTSVAKNVFVEAHQPIGWAVASCLVAVLLAPLIDRLDRVLPRGLSIVLAMLLVLVLVATIGVALYTDLRTQVDRLAEALPAAAADLEGDGVVGDLVADLRLQERLQALVDDLDDRYSERAALEGTVGTLPAYFVNGILVVFFVVWGPRMYEGYLRQVGGDERRDRHRTVISTAVRRSRGYLLAVLAEAVVLGVVTALLLWALEVPSPGILGTIVGAMSLVPYVGVLFGALPALLLGAALRPSGTTLVLAVAFVAMQVGSALLQERIHERWMRAGPAVIVVAATIGFAAYGPGGAVYGAMAAVVATALLDVVSADGVSADGQDAVLEAGPRERQAR